MANVYVFNIASLCIHGEELLRQFTFRQKYRRSHNETDVRHIWKVHIRTIRRDLWSEHKNWEDSSWKHLSLVGGEEVISLSHTRVYVFSDSAKMPWKDEREPTIKLCMGRQVEVVQKFIRIQSFGNNWWWANGIRVEYLVFTTLQLCNKVQEFLSKMSDQPEEFKGRIIFMSMFNDISWGSQDNEQECELNANLVSICATRFSPGRWSFFGPGSEKKWYSIHEYKPQGEWDRVAEQMMMEFSESGHRVFALRVHCPEERSKAKVVENYPNIFALTRERLKLFFAQLFLLISSVFTEQSKKCVKKSSLRFV